MNPKEHAVNASSNFIAGWYLVDQDLCRDLVQYHRNSGEKHAGLMTGNT